MTTKRCKMTTKRHKTTTERTLDVISWKKLCCKSTDTSEDVHFICQTHCWNLISTLTEWWILSPLSYIGPRLGRDELLAGMGRKKNQKSRSMCIWVCERLYYDRLGTMGTTEERNERDISLTLTLIQWALCGSDWKSRREHRHSGREG